MRSAWVLVACVAAAASIHVPIWQGAKPPQPQYPIFSFGTPFYYQTPAAKGNQRLTAAASRNDLQKAAYPRHVVQQPFNRPAPINLPQLTYASKINAWTPIAPTAYQSYKIEHKPQVAHEKAMAYSPQQDPFFVIPSPLPYNQYRDRVLTNNYRDDKVYEPFFDELIGQQNDIPEVEREEHEKAPVSEQHEVEKEIPTRPLYPGIGKWAKRGQKHRPHVTQHKFEPPLQEDAVRPDGYEIFEGQMPNFLKQRAEFDHKLGAFPYEHNVALATPLVFQQSFPQLLPQSYQKQPRKKPALKKKKKPYVDPHYEQRPNYEDTFVPTRLYTQVRRTEDAKLLPRKPDEPRLREVVKDTKVATIYSEEGYEDLAYDHAGHEKKAESEEKDAAAKSLDEESAGDLLIRDDMRLGGSEYVEIMKTEPKKKKAKVESVEEVRTTAVTDLANATMMEMSSEVRANNATTKAHKYVAIVPKPAGYGAKDDTSNFISPHGYEPSHESYLAPLAHLPLPGGDARTPHRYVIAQAPNPTQIPEEGPGRKPLGDLDYDMRSFNAHFGATSTTAQPAVADVTTRDTFDVDRFFLEETSSTASPPNDGFDDTGMLGDDSEEMSPLDPDYGKAKAAKAKKQEAAPQQTQAHDASPTHFAPTPYAASEEDEGAADATKDPAEDADDPEDPVPTRESIQVDQSLERNTEPPAPTLIDQTAEEFYDLTTEPLGDDRYAVDQAGQGEISVKFEKLGGRRSRRKRQADAEEDEVAEVQAADIKKANATDDDGDLKEVPKLHLETDFVHTLKPPTTYGNFLGGPKFPYYAKAMADVDQNSPMRYAQNLNHVPDKRRGHMAFYKQAERLRCEEVESDVDPVPEHVRNAEGEDSNGEGADLPETPRLSSLGDKIDCFKARYFGEDPFDNPLFKEDTIATPQPIFNGAFIQATATPGVRNARSAPKKAKRKRGRKSQRRKRGRKPAPSPADDDDYFYDFFEKRKGNELPRVEQEDSRSRGRRPKNYVKNASRYDQQSNDEGGSEEEASVEESREKSESAVRRQQVADDRSEESEDEEKGRKSAPAPEEDASGESAEEKGDDRKRASGEEEEEEEEAPAPKKRPRQRDESEEKENASKAGDADYDAIINEEFKKFLTFPEDDEDEANVRAAVRRKHVGGRPQQSRAREEIRRRDGNAESDEEDAAEGEEEDERPEPKKTPRRHYEAESESEENPKATKPKPKKLKSADPFRPDSDEILTSEEKLRDDDEENSAAESTNESGEDAKDAKNKRPENIYDQIKLLDDDDLYDIGKPPPDDEPEKKKADSKGKPETATKNALGFLSLGPNPDKRNDTDEFRRSNLKVTKYVDMEEDSDESTEPGRKRPMMREELTIRYESPVKQKLAQRLKTPPPPEPQRHVQQSLRDETQRHLPPQRLKFKPQKYTRRPPPPRYNSDFAERSDNAEDNEQPAPRAQEEELTQQPPPPLSQAYKQPRRHNYWKFPPKPQPTLEIFDIGKFMPKAPYPLFIATPITIIPKYKTVSEVAYKQDIKPSEQLNVFQDVIKTIKKTSSQEVLQTQPSNLEGVSVKPPGRKRKTSSRGQSRFALPENHKANAGGGDYSKEQTIASEEETQRVAVKEVYKSKAGKRQPALKKPSTAEPPLDDGEPDASNEVVGLKPPPETSPKATHKTRGQHHQVPDDVNNFYVIGMRPPPASKNRPIYSDYKIISQNLKRRVKTKSKRRRTKRDAAKPSYSEISRSKPKPKDDAATGEDDDYVPHRPRNYHYDVETHQIVYDGPRNYEYVERTSKATTTKGEPVVEREVVSTKRIPAANVGPDGKGEPTYIDFVLKLKSSKNYKVIPDPEPTEKPATTKAPSTTTEAAGPKPQPEFLSVLARLKSDASYKVIEDKKQPKATTQQPSVAEEGEEVQGDVQNSPGGQTPANAGEAVVLDNGETDVKTKNYSPRTLVDTSKYKSIERSSRHNISSKYVEEPTTLPPISGMKSESSDNVEVVAQIATTTEVANDPAAQRRRRFRGRSRQRSSLITTTQATTTPDSGRKPPNRRRTTTTEKFLDEAAADSPRKSVYRRHGSPRQSETPVPANHKHTYTPVSESSRVERRKVKDVEVFDKYNPHSKHGGNYRKLEDQEAEKTQAEDSRLTDVVPKPYTFYTDPKLPKHVNQLKEPNTPSNHEEIEEVLEKRKPHLEDRSDDPEPTKKPFFIKDPSKRFYYYAPV